MEQFLFAGPWMGEFGWELFGWQSHLRWLSTKFDGILVCGPPGHEHLYEDFALKYIPFTPVASEPHMWAGQTNMWMRYGVALEREFFHEHGLRLFSHLRLGHQWIEPHIAYQQYPKVIAPGSKNHTFAKYGDRDAPDEIGYDMLFQARSTTKTDSGFKNWPEEDWKRLAVHFKNQGHSIASVGSLDGSLHVPGTSDIRGVPLKNLCTVMRKSKVIIGPSSGPMHLAALCDLPQVVWSGYFRSTDRHLKSWNPYKTNCIILTPKEDNDPWDTDRGSGWNPFSKEVIEAVESFWETVVVKKEKLILKIPLEAR